MRQEQTIEKHRVVIFQEGDIINNPFILEVTSPDQNSPEYRGSISFSVAYQIWKRFQIKPEALLLEEAKSYISDKTTRLQLIEQWAQTFK